ncbi:MAG: hypothetical protein J6Y72_10970 [Bacteroidales bacterium]|nr:hypothetical protein [Bacteroidales bacterium]
MAGDVGYFVKFVEACVSPFVRSNADDIKQYVNEINSLLNIYHLYFSSIHII